MKFQLKETLRNAFETKLNEQRQKFDQTVGLIKTYRGPGYAYHSNLRNCEAHMIRESLYYALALLDWGNPDDIGTARRIIDICLRFQDLDKSSATYGIWPYFIEESIDEMPVADWNWADFCGKALLQILLDYSHVLGEELVQRVRISLDAAAHSILKRDVPPSYTNISIMGTYVSLLSGEALNKPDLIEYGKEKLRKLFAYNLYQGAFTEYNSPTYTMVAIEDLSLMLRDVKDAEAKEMLEELNDMAWACVATHFHAATRQWAGPHSRCYNTLQGKEFLSFIRLATDGKVSLIDENEMQINLLWPRIGMKCPEKYFGYFLNEGEKSFSRQTVFRQQPSVEAAMYMSPAFTLGSFNRSDLWNQRRALISYFGSAEAPSFMRFGCIHEDYDYSAAILNCLQDRNFALGIANFSTDHGDKHFTLDKIKDGKIEASYLSFRFEFGGHVENINIPEGIELGKPFVVSTPTCNIGIAIVGSSFGGYDVKLKCIEKDDIKAIDIVLYDGKAKQLDFCTLGEAYAAFGVVIEEPSKSEEDIIGTLSEIKLSKKGAILTLSHRGKYTDLELSASIMPGRYLETIKSYSGVQVSKIPVSNHIWVNK